MEKQVNEMKGEDIDISILPFDSDYKESFESPKVKGFISEIRPFTTQEKKDHRRNRSQASLNVRNGITPSDCFDRCWDVVFNCVLSWKGLETQTGKPVEFNKENWDLVPDWVRDDLEERVIEISNLGLNDKRVLG